MLHLKTCSTYIPAEWGHRKSSYGLCLSCRRHSHRAVVLSQAMAWPGWSWRKQETCWVWQCHKGTTHQIDGWNPTHKNADEWGMIAIPTLHLIFWYEAVSFWWKSQHWSANEHKNCRNKTLKQWWHDLDDYKQPPLFAGKSRGFRSRFPLNRSIEMT